MQRLRITRRSPLVMCVALCTMSLLKTRSVPAGPWRWTPPERYSSGMIRVSSSLATMPARRLAAGHELVGDVAHEVAGVGRVHGCVGSRSGDAVALDSDGFAERVLQRCDPRFVGVKQCSPGAVAKSTGSMARRSTAFSSRSAVRRSAPGMRGVS